MAARRLIIILVLLLAASVLAASLAPDRMGRLEVTETTTDSSAAADPKPTGKPLSVRIDAARKKPETVEAFAGDQLSLSVGSASGRTITIEPLGLAEFAGPDSPAHFDLLLRDPGTIPITDDRGQVVGKLLVMEPKGSRGGDSPNGAGGGGGESQVV